VTIPVYPLHGNVHHVYCKDSILFNPVATYAIGLGLGPIQTDVCMCACSKSVDKGGRDDRSLDLLCRIPVAARNVERDPKFSLVGGLPHEWNTVATGQ
jgi:hypothetical protein